jgi:hypothetical protein
MTAWHGEVIDARIPISGPDAAAAQAGIAMLAPKRQTPRSH